MIIVLATSAQKAARRLPSLNLYWVCCPFLDVAQKSYVEIGTVIDQPQQYSTAISLEEYDSNETGVC